jgi:hypothetical protein
LDAATAILIAAGRTGYQKCAALFVKTRFVLHHPFHGRSSLKNSEKEIQESLQISLTHTKESLEIMKRQNRSRKSQHESVATVQTLRRPTNEEIRQRAHEIFLAQGGIPGRELDDWLQAEQELKRKFEG